MTPETASAIHQAAFTAGRGWSAAEIDALMQGDSVTLFEESAGFALVRTVAREAELLTLAVDPAHQRRGIGRSLMRTWMNEVPADEAFLEVAEDNTAACALYHGFGFTEVGRRRAYYARKDAPAVDALVLRARLPAGHRS